MNYQKTIHEYFKSGRHAVRWIYLLVIGLAITKSIETLFQVQRGFQLPALDTWLLFVVLSSFLIRFFLGGYRGLSYDVEIESNRWRILIDSVFLVFQALLFYVFSLSFFDFQYSHALVFAINIIGFIWLALLAAIQGSLERTARIWLGIDIAVAFLVAFNFLIVRNIYFLVVISILAAAIDFWLNGEYFFSFNHSPRLRIFVAGPYGDNEPKEVIDKNVENAKKIGQELALKGHIPFIPHTMLHGWEMDSRFTIDNFKVIDYSWLEFCDALFYIGDSPGAMEERKIAIQKGLQIFTRLEKIPNANYKEVPRF